MLYLADLQFVGIPFFGIKTILNHLLFAVIFLVEYKSLLFHLFFSFSLLFDLTAEVILSAILFPSKSPVASAVF